MYSQTFGASGNSANLRTEHGYAPTGSRGRTTRELSVGAAFNDSLPDSMLCLFTSSICDSCSTMFAYGQQLPSIVSVRFFSNCCTREQGMNKCTSLIFAHVPRSPRYSSRWPHCFVCARLSHIRISPIRPFQMWKVSSTCCWLRHPGCEDHSWWWFLLFECF